MTPKLQEGDFVHVDFNGAQFTLCHCARVDHIPVATGDSWIFVDMQTGKVHYVSEGCTVTKIGDAGSDPCPAHKDGKHVFESQRPENAPAGVNGPPPKCKCGKSVPRPPPPPPPPPPARSVKGVE